jgi:hypothetical protein
MAAARLVQPHIGTIEHQKVGDIAHLGHDNRCPFGSVQMLLHHSVHRATASVCVPIPFRINLPAKTGATISINRLCELVLIPTGKG